MIDKLPHEIVYNIATLTDVVSIPNIQATSRTMCNQVTNEFFDACVIQQVKTRLGGIINVVKQYHKVVSNDEVEKQLLKTLLVQLYERQKEKRSLVALAIFTITGNVAKEIRTSRYRVKETWKRFIQNMPYEENDYDILNSLKRVLLGHDQSLYVVSFIYYNQRLKQKTHYCVINFKFQDNSVKMAFSIENLEPYTNKRILKSMRSMEVIVDDSTLTKLAEFIVKDIGREICVSEIRIANNLEIWVGPLTQYAQGIFDSAINSIVNPETYRESIFNILTDS